MTRRTVIAAALGLYALTGAASAAASTTIGSVGTSAAGETSCASQIAFYQSATDGSVSYRAPIGASLLTQWQTYAPTGTGGKHLTLLVMRPSSDGYTVESVDSQTLPADGSGAGQIDTFSPAQPPLLLAGDTLALYSSDSSGPMCAAHTAVSADVAAVLAGGTPAAPAPLNGPPTVGQTLSAPPIGTSANFLLNVSATLTPAQLDAGVNTTVPSNVTPGGQTFITSTVSNSSSTPGSVTFTEIVAGGLPVQGGFSPAGTCTTSGQTLSCPLTLGAGASAPVYVLVNALTAGSYPIATSVAPAQGINDPNPANNSANATLVVTAPPATTTRTAPQPCRVPKLGGLSNRFAAQLLPLLGCKVGKAFSIHSKSVKTGLVVTTSPGPGTYVAGRVIRIEVSSGPKPKHKAKPKPKRRK